MSTEWFEGVPWLDRALDAANHRGIATRVASIARDYREGAHEGLEIGPETDEAGNARPDIVRVTRGLTSAIIGQPANVVLGYAVTKRGRQ